MKFSYSTLMRNFFLYLVFVGRNTSAARPVSADSYFPVLLCFVIPFYVVFRFPKFEGVSLVYRCRVDRGLASGVASPIPQTISSTSHSN